MEVVGFNPSNSVVFQIKHIMSNIESNLDIKKKELEKYNVGTLNYSKLEGEIEGLKYALWELESQLQIYIKLHTK